jgi:hypothetical protein
MPKHDSWDWPFLLYIATVLFRRSERQFWRMTPRKLNALAAIHIRLNATEDEKKNEQTHYIDQIM